MKRALWLLVLPLFALAADDRVTRGAAVYRASCAVPYCHGPEGAAGRAPALAGRGLQPAVIMAIVAGGIPNTSMPSFANQLKPEDIQAIAAYIVSLGGSGSSQKAGASVKIPAEAQPGWSLFFDASRTGACGSCHELDGRGAVVSVALQDPRRARVADLRNIETPEVVTAQPPGENPFPAVIVEKSAARIRVYDLSPRLPVLRTFAPNDVVLKPGSSWRHSEAAALYTDAELASISRYLNWVAAR